MKGIKAQKGSSEKRVTNKAEFHNSSLFLYVARGHSLFPVSLLIFFLFSSPIDIFTKVSFSLLLLNLQHFEKSLTLLVYAGLYGYFHKPPKSAMDYRI